MASLLPSHVSQLHDAIDKVMAETEQHLATELGKALGLPEPLTIDQALQNAHRIRIVQRGHTRWYYVDEKDLPVLGLGMLEITTDPAADDSRECDSCSVTVTARIAIYPPLHGHLLSTLQKETKSSQTPHQAR